MTNNKIISIIAFLLLSGHLYSQQSQFEVLVYTTPDPLHGAAIPTFINEMEELAVLHNFGMQWTQTGDAFSDENLKRFDAVLFLSARSISLSEAQLESLKAFIRSGGGYVGIHSVILADDFAIQLAGKAQDEWYRKLIGRDFYSHSGIQTAVIKVCDREFPATMHLPDQWLWTEEWYDWGNPLTDKLHDVLLVDEKTYDIAKGHWPGTSPVKSMGNYHPVAWYQEFDGGRSFYTALGHSEISYTDEAFMNHLYGGIYWAATGLGITK
jgi:type 1 glutamine amidotransferase